MARHLKAVKCPNEELSLTNCAVVSDKDFDVNRIKHLEVITGPNHHYIFSIRAHPSIAPGSIAFSAPQRRWAVLSLGQEVDVRPYVFNSSTDYLSNIILEVDFYPRKNASKEPYDTDKMAVDFLNQFPHQAFSVGQELVFSVLDKKMIIAVVKELEGLNVKTGEMAKINVGMTMPNTTMCFERGPNSTINLVGKSRGKQTFQSIINPNWNFEQMGIGGLNDEVSRIFRSAFCSRILPMEVFEQMGIKHCKGILLHGPPGTGKTLIARQIGKMLNARPPKIVNGPEILDKYVGESEANIRKLFADAEEEERKVGPNSGLHIIIFDEIDAICKARGSVSGGTGVNDSIVNQLLAKMDGVDQLNNIIVIGMTNRKDMIDEALMRPGRLEVQVEIGLPNREGRLNILKIHTTTMRENGRLAPDVDLQELASLTKNFSGAELEGLVKAAASKAMWGLIKGIGDLQMDLSKAGDLKVDMSMFRHALAEDIKAAFGMNEEIMKVKSGGIINWGDPVSSLLEEGDNMISQIKFGENSQILSVLLEGAPGSGKTALAATLATKSEFPFIKMSSAYARIGQMESAKVQAIKKMFDDAYKSPLSCIILDDLEGLMDYVAIGPRFSTMMFQALRTLLIEPPPAGHRLFVIATSSCKDLLHELKILSSFDKIIHVYNISSVDHLVSCLEEMNIFTPRELDVISRKVGGKSLSIGIKKLMKIADGIRQTEDEYRVPKFLSTLEKDGYLN